MVKGYSSSINNLEEGVNIESNLGDSDKRDKKLQEEGVPDSDSKIKEIDTELEKKERERQNNQLTADSKNDIRRIIKLEPENENEGLEDSEDKNAIDEIVFEDDKSEDNISDSSEKRDINPEKEIHDMKELDSQIKENNDLIRKLEEKVGSISEDMNDLIGLYEIVSGQMNPFVGLSKVTKKRLDVLENFGKEIVTLRNRLDNLEPLVGKIDLSKDSFEDFSPVEDIDDVIGRALEFVLERRKIDEIIERAIESIKMGALSSNNMGG
ncbi:MAG: hypothetical protein KAQ84_00165 [Thermoplasmatales archaeon]|nr:hypothetical protein [Thermoplasmatales archaeon]MCK5261028.1 hypothetical protein [Thermoplasmatales archaeon]